MRVELFFRPHLCPGGDLRGIIDIARVADQAGLRSIFFGEHLLIGQRTDRAPHLRWPHGHDTPWLEPLTTLGAIASVTKQIRLSTGVLLAPLRSAILLAKSVATLDVLSSGRVDLAIGTGWQREEYEASGVSWADRYKIMDESVELCREVWAEQPVSPRAFDGIIDRAYVLPRPVQERIPVLYGVAATPGNVRRIAAHGDGWYPVGLTPDEVRKGTEEIREAFVEQGRDPSSLMVRALIGVYDDDEVLDVARTIDQAPAFFDAGATTVCTGPKRMIDDRGALRGMIEDLARGGAELG